MNHMQIWSAVMALEVGESVTLPASGNTIVRERASLAGADYRFNYALSTAGVVALEADLVERKASR